MMMASSCCSSSSYPTGFQRSSVSLASSSTSSSPSPSTSSSTGRISPTVMFIIVIVAVVFFVGGLLHLLIRYLTKKKHHHHHHRPSSGAASPTPISGTEALQRQLQQLFHLHDSGLDQAFIDALPVFLYGEILGPKEPFDCAVCLSEFAADDRLRLLPVCSHAFHLACIDAWLLSNSTCPLCRGSLFVPCLPIHNPVFDDDDDDDDDDDAEDLEDGRLPRKRGFSVRLGKFRAVQTQNPEIADDPSPEKGESSTSNLDARRCYSMGSYQYVVGDSILKVPLGNNNGKDDDGKGSRRRRLPGHSVSAGVSIAEGFSGKRLCVGSKGESFSVSKIWQWSNKKGKFPISSSSDTASLDGKSVEKNSDNT